MAHVVMQAAEFSSVDEAMHAEAELQRLFDAYVAFERTDPEPWSQSRVPPPLVEFGARHNVPWPLSESSLFLLKGLFDDVAALLRVDRMVFFYGGGFDLGGETLRKILGSMGAVSCTAFPHLVVQCENPGERVDELAHFLAEEDYEDQFTVVTDNDDQPSALFSVTLQGKGTVRRLSFDDSGVQDWAFVTLLPQLDGEEPRLGPLSAPRRL